MPVILFVVEREEPVHACLSRALMLARYLKARLDIVLCGLRALDTAHPAAAARASEEAREYLGSLRQSIAASDVDITTDLAQPGPLHEVISERARLSKAALIIKRPSHGHTLGRIRADWQLMQNPPAPLLLTEGKPWRPRPHFAAAVDIMDPLESRPDAIVEAAVALRTACGAELDLIYAHPEQSPREPTEGECPELARLQRLAQAFEIHSSQLHLLSGKPGAALPRFLAGKQYDLLVMGAPARSHSLLSRAHDLSSTLRLAPRGGDLLIVNHRDIRDATALSGRRRSRWDGMPWWQYIGAD